MIVFLGDIHGDFVWLPRVLENIPLDATIIQVGDFGAYPGYDNNWVAWWRKTKRTKPMYFIDGNHENHILLSGIEEQTEIWPGAMYLPRGTVLEVDGFKIGCLGGAASPDYKLRSKGINWFEDEVLLQESVDKLKSNDHIDALVAHTPPRSFISKHYTMHPSVRFPHWGLTRDWYDPSPELVEDAWNHFGNPPLFCGHFHDSIVDGNIRLLDINETYVWKD